MTSFYNLLKYAATGIASPDMTYYDRMRASTLMGGAVQTLTGQPPLSFKADGTPLISWSMLGNRQQSGTPTPDVPITPAFCGVRTANLFDGSVSGTSSFLTSDGGISASSTWNISDYIPCNAETTYTIENVNAASVSPSVCFYSSQKIFLGGVNYNHKSGITFETPVDCSYLKVSYRKDKAESAMLNTGSTALPYEPYGYKIPISCASQTVPIYLGQTQTIRKIGKVDLASLSWTSISSGLWRSTSIQNIKYVSSNEELGNGMAEKYNMHTGKGMSTAVNCIAIDTSQISVNTGDGTVKPSGMFWYALAEPETAIVNEPIAKIGDYADELNSTDAGVTIPTAKGQNVLTVDTTLQPSEMTITYRE